MGAHGGEDTLGALGGDEGDELPFVRHEHRVEADDLAGAAHGLTLLRAYEIGRRAGLRYIYPGNIPGAVGDR